MVRNLRALHHHIMMFVFVDPVVFQRILKIAFYDCVDVKIATFILYIKAFFFWPKISFFLLT